MDLISKQFLDLENWGVLFGFISVYFTVKENILCWYFGIINVILFAILFLQTEIFGQMFLQVFFFVVTIYGIFKWKYGGENKTELKSRYITKMEIIYSFLFIVFATFLISYIIHRFLEKENFTYLDSFITSLSFAAQFLQARKVLESWLLWIIVDILSVYLFVQSNLIKVGIFYFILLILATLGYFTWNQKLKQQV